MAQDPSLLLRMLEAFNTTLHLQPQECVAFALRNSTLITQPGMNKVRMPDVFHTTLNLVPVGFVSFALHNSTLITQPGMCCACMHGYMLHTHACVCHCSPVSVIALVGV